MALFVLMGMAAFGSIDKAYADVSDVDAVTPASLAGDTDADCNPDTDGGPPTGTNGVGIVILDVNNENTNLNGFGELDTDAPDTSTIILSSTTAGGLPNTVVICADVSSADPSTVTFDSNDYGTWQAICFDAGVNSDWHELNCDEEDGSGTDQLHIEEAGQETEDVAAAFICQANPGRADVVVQQDAEEDTFTILCLGPAASGTLTLYPARVQPVPAFGDTAHSLAILRLADSAGGQAFPGGTVDWSVTNGCFIDTSEVDDDDELSGAFAVFSTIKPNFPATGANANFWSGFSPPHQGDPFTTSEPSFVWDQDGPLGGGGPGTGTIAAGTVSAAIIHCDDPGVTPGSATVTATIERPGPNLVVTATLTIVGPPHNIVVSVDNSSPLCGGRVTVTARITDAVGQNVSDHTVAEMISNIGTVLGGTGSVAGYTGPVTPISSAIGETFSGVVTFFVLTSDTMETHYEIVVTSGGGGMVPPEGIDDESGEDEDSTSLFGGWFSTPPVSGYAAFDCKMAPAVAAPNTGTGTLRAPNTGDAGLASTSGGTSWMLVGFAAVVASLMGLGALKAVRR